MKKDLICIVCPRGCEMKVIPEGDSFSVEGNACPKGALYAREEMTCPTRTLTAVIRVENRKDTMLSVKTNRPIPKEKVLPLMEILRKYQVSAPVKAGDVILEEVFGSRVIATKDISEEK